MFNARVELDSISPTGRRLITVVATYPRIVHCFDDQTQVLVEVNGRRSFIPWKEVALLNPLDFKMAAYNGETQSITFEHTKQLIVKDHNGPMISVDNQRLSMCVTPEHRLWVGSRKSNREEWEIIRASELAESTQKRFRCGGFVADGTPIDHDMSKLIGLFVGDGTIPENSLKAVFHLKKQRKIKFLHTLLRKLKIEFTFTPYSDGTSNTKFEALPVFQKCYSSTGVKQVPDEITRSTPDSIYAFLYGLWFSDGSTDKGECVVFNTSSHLVADQLSSLASMINEKITLTEPYETTNCHLMFKLTRQKEKEPIFRRDKTPVNTPHYKGKVYCATVSTGLLVVRRNGIAHVSGNCELMTHRAFARNAASSRAIPFQKMVQAVMDDPFIPIKWGAEQKGMQTANSEVTDTRWCRGTWILARNAAVSRATELHNAGLHKSLCNRLLEPFSWITTIITATEWENFFRLRCHPAAEIHLQKIAYMIRDAIADSEPKELDYGDWHTPFIKPNEAAEYPNLSKTEWLNVSVARCARVSYLTHDGVRDPQKDLELYSKLANGVAEGIPHASPFEHVATPSKTVSVDPGDGWIVDRDVFSGPFCGWRQYRKDHPNENEPTSLNYKVEKTSRE